MLMFCFVHRCTLHAFRSCTWHSIWQGSFDAGEQGKCGSILLHTKFVVTGIFGHVPLCGRLIRQRGGCDGSGDGSAAAGGAAAAAERAKGAHAGAENGYILNLVAVHRLLRAAGLQQRMSISNLSTFGTCPNDCSSSPLFLVSSLSRIGSVPGLHQHQAYTMQYSTDSIDKCSITSLHHHCRFSTPARAVPKPCAARWACRCWAGCRWILG